MSLTKEDLLQPLQKNAPSDMLAPPAYVSNEGDNPYGGGYPPHEDLASSPNEMVQLPTDMIGTQHFCNKCNKNTNAVMEEKASRKQFMCCCGMMMLCLWWCLWIPFMIKKWRVKVYSCPRCRTVLHKEQKQ